MRIFISALKLAMSERYIFSSISFYFFFYSICFSGFCMRTIGSTFYIAILDEFKIDMEISLFWGTVYDLSERNLLNVTQI